MDAENEDVEIVVLLEEIINIIKVFYMFVYVYHQYFMLPRRSRKGRRIRLPVRYRMADRIPEQVRHMSALVEISDVNCIEQLRMDRNAFGRLCHVLESVGGLRSTRNVRVSEQVAIFLRVLAHHHKNRVVKFNFKRSGRTVSTYFNRILNVVVRLHQILAPQPDPVDQSCTDDRWKWFQGCLGALDGTHVDVHVPTHLMPRYMNRRGDATVNILGVCDRNLNLAFVLTGWEGSSADSRVLRDAVTREGGLRVPTGNYYLCDSGYTKEPGFLTPYRGVRYHLKEWSSGADGPQNYKELFNLRHAKARNIIERAFGILKNRWAILRSCAFYPIKTQNRMILACCLIHNFIRNNMLVDLEDGNFPEFVETQTDAPNELAENYVDQVEPSQQWTDWREALALAMYNDWRGI